MTRYEEENMVFDFGAAWQTDRYDKSPQHVERMMPHLQSKAVDFIAWNDNLVLLIEAKDLRGFAADNEHKFGGSLATTIGRKVRDTVAGMVGRGRNNDPEPLVWQRVVRAMAKPEQDVLVVLFLEQDGYGTMTEQKARMSVENKLLNQRLKWLGARCIITNIETCAQAIPGLTVSNLKGAAGHGGKAARGKKLHP